MAMMPKRVKYRKSQKGRVRGNATRGNYVAFGEFGLQALEPGRISAETIEAGRIVASQSVKGGGKLYIRIFPHKSVTSIPAETRMGKGKGEVEYWAAVVKPGTDPLRARRRQRGRGPRRLRPRRPQAARDLPVRRPPAHPLSRPDDPSPPTGRPTARTTAMSKPAELREQNDEQLELLLKETQQNLFRLRLQSETERLEAPSEIIKAKREIARIKTILRAPRDRPASGRPPAATRPEPTGSDPTPNRPTGTSPMSQPTAASPTPRARAPSQDRDRRRDLRQDEQDPAGRDRAARPAPEVRQVPAAAHRLPRPRRGRTQTHVGDLVEIMETRPLSKLKRWRIVRIVRQGAQQALAGEGEAGGAAAGRPASDRRDGRAGPIRRRARPPIGVRRLDADRLVRRTGRRPLRPVDRSGVP